MSSYGNTNYSPGAPGETATAGANSGRFGHPTYMIHKKFWKLVGGTFFVFDPHEQLVLYSQLKAFKLKEDIRIFTGEDMQTEVISIKARNYLDVSATYDVTDTASGQRIGSLKRKGLKSVIQDEWLILDANGNETGTIKEDSLAIALVRRFIDYATFFLPQKYTGEIRGKHVCSLQQNRHPMLTKLTIDFTPDTGNLLDRRLGVAAAILLCAIEGKQR